MELRPAHETILKHIEHHCSELKVIEKDIAHDMTDTSSGASLPPFTLEGARHMHMGGLCSLLETLNETIVPTDKLDALIEGLRNLDYRHCEIWSTIKNLTKRTS